MLEIDTPVENHPLFNLLVKRDGDDAPIFVARWTTAG